MPVSILNSSATKRDNFCAVIELGGNKYVQLA